MYSLFNSNKLTNKNSAKMCKPINFVLGVVQKHCSQWQYGVGILIIYMTWLCPKSRDLLDLAQSQVKIHNLTTWLSPDFTTWPILYFAQSQATLLDFTTCLILNFAQSHETLLDFVTQHWLDSMTQHWKKVQLKKF